LPAVGVVRRNGSTQVNRIMGARRKSRELVLQVLFHMDIQKSYEPEMSELFCQVFPPGQKSKAFFCRLLDGVLAQKSAIDHLIERHSSNWTLSRMAAVDRNLLRIAVYELLFCEDIPQKVSINEAIDLGKKFGTDESGAFINGILDSIRMAIDAGDATPVKSKESEQ
jgi:N utilization substance protein B